MLYKLVLWSLVEILAIKKRERKRIWRTHKKRSTKAKKKRLAHLDRRDFWASSGWIRITFLNKFLGHKVIKCQIKKKSNSKYSIEESIHTGRLKPTARDGSRGWNWITVSSNWILFFPRPFVNFFSFVKSFEMEEFSVGNSRWLSRISQSFELSFFPGNQSCKVGGRRSQRESSFDPFGGKVQRSTELTNSRRPRLKISNG